jgi:mannose-1-phosphate guanylyltransferase
MNKKYYCVIMAGGAGTRFWPMSRSSFPKQFIDILGVGRTLLQQTFDRFSKICPVENIYIVTSAEYQEITLEQLPQISETQVLLEPARRNTAPCIAYANFRIQKINPNAKIVVAPSDHLILKEDKFIETIQNCFNFVTEHNSLLTIGIEPSRPDTGYGYIQVNNDEPALFNNSIEKVKTFTEKPDLELAKFFVESGEFYWNSGIFIWSLNAIQDAFKIHLEDIYTSFNEKLLLFATPEENKAIAEIYPACRNISIDYGIMEKATNVYVLGSEFGWSDLGTWTSLFEHTPKSEDNNALTGKNIMTYDTKDTLIKTSKDKLVVVQGLTNYIVVDTEDALLICNKNEEQQIKLFVNDIKTQKKNKFI